MERYILIVDDQPVIRHLIQDVLREFGFKTKTVTNGRECLTVARSHDKPSLILLDNQMPHMTGIEVLTRLKKDEATCEIPIIMISGTQNLEETAKSLGANAVLAKPLDLNTLIETIHCMLAEYSPENKEKSRKCIVYYSEAKRNV